MEENVPTSAGLSSYNLLDENRFFDALGPLAGMSMLDLACGLGNYAIAAAPRIGDRGRIYALDLWDEGIETLQVRAAIGGLNNISASVCDASAPLPLTSRSVDICLLATIVHILVRENRIAQTLAEVLRVIRPEGRVAVVEFHKIDGPPGPPLAWRLAPQELEGIFAPLGFRHTGTAEVGPYNYLSLFRPYA